MGSTAARSGFSRFSPWLATPPDSPMTSGKIKMDIKKEYERWLANATADADVAAELKTLDDAKVEDAFYRDLAFGTGGLRGVIGAGTNRMNIYTVAKASEQARY